MVSGDLVLDTAAGVVDLGGGVEWDVGSVPTAIGGAVWISLRRGMKTV